MTQHSARTRRALSHLWCHAPVAWIWFTAVVLTYSVQLGVGLTSPSMGLALSAAALPAALVAATRPSLRVWTGWLAVALLALTALANAIFYRYFVTYIPLRMVGASGQGWDVRGYVLGLLAPSDAIAALVLLATGVVFTHWNSRRPSIHGARAIAVPVAICLLGSTPAVAYAVVRSPSDADWNTAGFLYAHLVDARSIVGQRASGPTDVERARVARHLDTRVAVASDPDDWFGTAEGASVLLVQVESMNGWLLDTTIDGAPVMPFLRSLADGGLQFTNVFDQTHGGLSSDADYLVMGSQHPLQRAAVAMRYPYRDAVALPTVLASHGYDTMSGHTLPSAFWNAGKRRASYGFEQSFFESDLGPGERWGFGLLDSVFFERVFPVVEQLDRPYLAWLITFTMHGPHWDAPEAMRFTDLGRLEGTPIGNYILKARHTDEALERFVGRLRAAGALENTLLVVYGDHDDTFGFDEIELARLAGTKGMPEGAAELLRARVPLIISGPGIERVEQVDRAGGLVDLAPTLLHLLGVEAPRAYVGSSLLREGPGLAATAAGAAADGRHLWSRAECFDRRSETIVADFACSALRERAKEQLEVSWLITHMGLSPELSVGWDR